MRLDTNLEVLSSRERTMAPSFLLLISSYKPGKPVTAIILLYSIKMSIHFRECKIIEKIFYGQREIWEARGKFSPPPRRRFYFRPSSNKRMKRFTTKFQALITVLLVFTGLA